MERIDNYKFILMSKYQVFALTVLLFSTLAIAAEVYESSASRNLQATCPTAQITLGDGTTCFKCGTTGSFTKTKKNATACTCNPSSLTWSNDGYCDCGPSAAILINSGKPTCVTCDVKVNAIAKKDNITCECIEGLTWKSTLKRCECDDPAVYAGGQCLTCDDTIFAIGVNSKKAGQCACLIADMKWSSTDLKCGCSNANAVIWVIDSVVSCKICGSTINALSTKNSDTACDCPDGLSWTDNVGCACPEGQVLIPGAKPRCVSCDEKILATSISEDTKSCVCLSDALKWYPKAGKCACPKSTQIPVGDPIVCFECNNSTALATLPVVILNQTSTCSCKYKILTWSADTQTCSCPETQIFVASPKAACIACNETFNGTVLTDTVNPDVPNTCKCADGLTFINGKCECSKTSAYTVVEGTITCVNCNNASIFTKSRKNASECNCISTALTWNTTTGICSCPYPKVPYGKNAGVKCASCSGFNIVTGTLNETNSSLCACASSSLVYSISAAGVPSCLCPVNNIVDFDQACIACPTATADGGLGVVLTAHECKCAPTFFWSSADSACKKCSGDANAKATGGNNIACVCNSGDTKYVWDVITQACIEPCEANDASCLTCEDGNPAVLASTLPVSTRITVAGADAIKALLTSTAIPTNYALLSKYQCGCPDGKKWDVSRLKCVPSNIN